MKKRLKLLHHISAALMLTLGASIVLNSLHAKDAAALAKTPVDHAALQKVAAEEAGFKLGSEFHNHVDKHTLKSLTKTFSEHINSTDPRAHRHQHQKDEDEFTRFLERLKRLLHTTLLLGANHR